MAESGAPSAKICHYCNADCSAKPRTKDDRGRYYCRECYDKARAQAAARKMQAAAIVAPAAKPVPRAKPVAQSAKKAVARAVPVTDDAVDAVVLDDDFDTLASLDEMEAAAPAAVIPAGPRCPGCGAGLVSGGMMCTSCGMNLVTGKPMGVAAAPKIVKAKAARSGSGFNVGGLLGHPVMFSLVPLVMLVAVGLPAMKSDSMLLLYSLLSGALLLAAVIWCMVKAFADSAGRGVLCFFCTPYALYYALSVNDDPRLKHLWLGAVVNRAFSFYISGSLLGAGLAGANGALPQ